MPDDPASAHPPIGTPPLIVVCVLTLVSVMIAFLGATPARVGATELLGDERGPGDAAFIASHRGGGATAPENTLPAISAALSAGFDYVEVDLALTADGHAVLMHDTTVDRTTNGHGPIAALTLQEVRALDAGSWFAPEFAGTPVPTAVEFLDLLAGTSHRAIVELKGRWDAPAVEELVRAVEERSLGRRVALSSFDARTLAMTAAASETIPRLLILSHLPADVVRAAEQAGARGFVVSRTAVLAQPDVVDAAHAADLRVVVYTLNHDRQWDEMTALGVDGIVTDDPGTLSEWQRASAGGG